jgi:hypothetical protein
LASSRRSSPADSYRTYRAFGFNLATDLPFRHHLGEGQGKADLMFTHSSSPVVPGSWKDESPIYQSPWHLEDGESVSRLYRLGPGLGAWEVFCFPGLADFYLQADCIVGQSLGSTSADLVELRFLGPVLSYWMERRGIPTLHASAVAVNGTAVAFLSCHGGGKTGLAATLMRTGRPLLTDDVLPIEETSGGLLARPGYPQVRMWPDEASHFVERWEELPIVLSGLAKRRVRVGAGGFGAFCDSPLPLAALYVVERRPEGPVEILDLSPRDALIELVRHSFIPHLVEAAGLQAARFDLFARLVRSVPVRRLVYPSGFERLAEIAEILVGSW